MITTLRCTTSGTDNVSVRSEPAPPLLRSVRFGVFVISCSIYFCVSAIGLRVGVLDASGGIAERISGVGYCDRCYFGVVCSSVTLVHFTKADGRNETPFGRESHIVTSAKEVMFLPDFVCLFVCLFVCVLAR